MTAATTPSPQRRACCGGDCSASGSGDDDEHGGGGDIPPSSPTSTSTSTRAAAAAAGIRFRASLPAVLAKVLSMVALLTFLSAAVHDSSTSSTSTRMLRKTASSNHQKPFVPPWFCHDRPCPPFDELASPSPSLYSVRKYRRSNGGPPSPSSLFWARVRNISVSTYEAAYASGSLAIAAYAHGDNAEGRRVPSSCFGLPTLVSFFPADDGFSRAEDRYDVSSFLVPEVAPGGKSVVPFPDPPSSSGGGGGGGGGGGATGGLGLEIEEDDGDEAVAYVVQFGGFASGKVSLANAARLALALERDGLAYRSDVVVLASYDPPTRLLQRHNEVWLLAPPAEKAGGELKREKKKKEKTKRGKEEEEEEEEDASTEEEEKSKQKKKHKSKNRKSGGDDGRGGGAANTAFAA